MEEDDLLLGHIGKAKRGGKYFVSGHHLHSCFAAPLCADVKSIVELTQTLDFVMEIA